MTGRHEAPPLGSAVRDATAPPYHGRHRAEDEPDWHDRCPRCSFCGHHRHAGSCSGYELPDERAGRVADERWSDPEDTHEGGPDDV